MMTGGEICDVMIFRPNRRSDHPERAYLLLGGGLLLLGGGLLWGRNGGGGRREGEKMVGGVRRGSPNPLCENLFIGRNKMM